ncbi:MAG: malate/lactate/ureidoglycolate dehydrogenase [Dongiaceae bacterium]
MSDHGVHLSAPHLRGIVAAICAAAGCTDEEAAAIAEHLIEANLTGHDSHGIRMLPEYVAAMRAGRLRLGQRARIVRDGGAVMVIDGGLGVGQVICREAMAIGINRAKAHGVALVALRRAHHLGRIGAWAEQCAAAGCASVHFVNVIGHRPYVAPYGGQSGRLATNPFCAGLPATGRPAVILDMATSKAAWGKLMLARSKGEPAPADTVIDAAGRLSSDPGVLVADPPGSLLPFGEHKGYGLAVICELFAGALGGGGTNRPETPLTDTITNNMLSFIIEPGTLVTASGLAREIDALIDWVKATAPREGFEEVLIPGEPEWRRRTERLANGIAIDAETWKDVLAAAASVGCVLGELAPRP